LSFFEAKSIDYLCDSIFVMAYLRYFGVALIIILLDQTSKMLVYHNMELHEEFNVIGSWFRIHYILNPGMAFGLEFSWSFGKIFLSLFRLVATVGIGYFMYLQIKSHQKPLFLVCLALILGGAVGNAIDSIFYGVFLENNVIPNAPTPWFHGQVIDMLYFPMIEGVIPHWFPVWSGQPFIFFSPVFNIADSSIFVGITMAIIFQRSFMSEETSDKFSSQSDVQEIKNQTHS
jgi:signal peptidase II